MPLESARNDVNAALAALSADTLREVVRELLRTLDDKTQSHLMNALRAELDQVLGAR